MPLHGDQQHTGTLVSRGLSHDDEPSCGPLFEALGTVASPSLVTACHRLRPEVRGHLLVAIMRSVLGWEPRPSRGRLSLLVFTPPHSPLQHVIHLTLTTTTIIGTGRGFLYEESLNAHHSSQKAPYNAFSLFKLVLSQESIKTLCSSKAKTW